MQEQDDFVCILKSEIGPIADAAVDAFACLYPKLSLPLHVWEHFREMISREIMFHDTLHGAHSLAESDIDVDVAVASGLRDAAPQAD